MKLKSLEDKLMDVDSDLQKKFAEFMLSGNSGGERKTVISNVDPHKICQIEGDLRRTIDNVNFHSD